MFGLNLTEYASVAYAFLDLVNEVLEVIPMDDVKHGKATEALDLAKSLSSLFFGPDTR